MGDGGKGSCGMKAGGPRFSWSSQEGLLGMEGPAGPWSFSSDLGSVLLISIPSLNCMPL